MAFNVLIGHKYQLYKAMNNLAVAKVDRILASGNCSINGDNLKRDPPIIHCIITRHWTDSDEEDRKRCIILKLLLIRGADVNTKSFGRTPSMLAANGGFLEGLKVLVEFKADLSTLTPEGDTALHLAVRSGHADCVRCLTEVIQASILDCRNTKGQTALMVALQSSNRIPIKAGELCQQYLLEAGAKLDLEDANGHTALIYALHVKSFKSVKLLLQKGAVVNTVTRLGWTPLTFTSVEDSCTTYELLRYGMDPALSRQDRHRLHAAVIWHQNEIIRWLILSGFPPLDEWQFPFKAGSNHCLETPVSPLALALLSRWPETAKYLISIRFFTPNDIVHLGYDREIRPALTYAYYHGRLQERYEAEESLEVLDFLLTKLHSLRDLCLVAISSALSQDLLLHVSNSHVGDQSRWTCKPTFREKVQLLKIPTLLKRELLHDTPAAKLCCTSWHDIRLQ